MILGLRPANEKRRYFVTRLSLAGRKPRISPAGRKPRISPVKLCDAVTHPNLHDEVIKWKYFPCYWPFVRGIHRSPGKDFYESARVNHQERRQKYSNYGNVYCNSYFTWQPLCLSLNVSNVILG